MSMLDGLARIVQFGDYREMFWSISHATLPESTTNKRRRSSETVSAIAVDGTRGFQEEVRRLKRQGGGVQVGSIAENDDGQLFRGEALDDGAESLGAAGVPHARAA